MIASKVIITAETRARLDNPILTPAKRRSLREEMIKERIRSATGGAATKQELIAAAGLNPDARSTEYAKGIATINSMVKRGIISHDDSNRFRKIWTVMEDVHTRPLVTPTPEELASELVIPKELKVELKEFEALTSVQLVDMAKEFAWQRNSDSLREFVEYAKNAIK